jgi:small ligand-binding sensory domain FIST
MPFASALSTNPDTRAALAEVCEEALGPLQGTPDLALLFFSPHHHPAAEHLAEASQGRLNSGSLLGCPGESIVGKDQEIENGPALSLWLARWPAGTSVQPFHMTLEQTSEGYTLLGWPDELGQVPPEQAFILLLADPFTFPVDAFLSHMNDEYPGLRVMGGMASGAQQPGENRLLLGNRVLDHGAIGVLVQGPVQARSVVSQGCRPIGRHLVITRAQDNIIMDLGGKPAVVQLQELWQTLPPRDQELVRKGLHVGRVISEYQGEFRRGDFLIRNVMGLDRQNGALAITDHVRVGQTVQFHVRDAATADEDLHVLLQNDLKSHATKPAGALLFTCNGRGSRLFEQPHHDARAVAAEAGLIPLAGFFAQGELGPVGGRNFIHGFTASVVLFEEG